MNRSSRSRPGKLLRTILHQVRVRPRLLIAAGVGLAAYLATAYWSPPPSGPARALVAWDVGAGLYLAFAWATMRRATVDHMRARAKEQDDGALAVLALSVGAGIAGLAAIVLLVVGSRGSPADERGVLLALAGITILFSWCFVHTAFAFHYAHEFYIDRGKEPCLEFPGENQPDYADFLYFSFVIGTTSQTADVSIRSRSLRRLALLHSVIAFFFNTTLLALTVNLAASLFQPDSPGR